MSKSFRNAGIGMAIVAVIGLGGCASTGDVDAWYPMAFSGSACTVALQSPAN